MFNRIKWSWIKLFLLALFFVLAHWQLPTIMVGQDISGGVWVCGAVWLLTLAATFMVAFVQTRWLRIVWAVVFSYTAINALSYYYITGIALNTIEVERLWQDVAFIGETFQFYGEMIAKSSLLALPLMLGILLPISGKAITSRRTIIAINIMPFLAFFLVGHTVYNDGGGDSDAFPVTTAPLGFVGVLAYDELTMAKPAPRETVSWPVQDQGFDKIVVLMDESARGDYLDVINPAGVPTHLLSFPDAVNFGIAASHANCSAASNLTFRYAARREHFLDDEKSRPSLWAYAHKAGYKTIYLDGQRTGHELQNFMTAAEKNEIDELLQHDDETIAKDKDRILVDKLTALLRRPERMYIYVNKAGVHFPYEGKYPEEIAPYQPHMSKTLIHTGESDEYGDSFGDEKFRNSYKNALNWNTGEFFKNLLPQLDLKKTLMIYTSDHGQNFIKTRPIGYLTHCSTGPTMPGEGTVPLVFMTEQAQWLMRLRAAAAVHKNQASHWNVPVTVIAAMGYPEEQLAQHYEPTIFAKDLGPQQFVSTYFVRFGLKPYWNKPLSADQITAP